ncbi:hypothetical protein N7456_001945 [Penicillium angulare]|uniref:Uncharacterized protein n=1 Tax=Penicillium angulare TaxID=116970 RepID=A0A9W9G785_9EURO|nr:hypothetical protein N7456_001945 [Penicillium angulare]
MFEFTAHLREIKKWLLKTTEEETKRKVQSPPEEEDGIKRDLVVDCSGYEATGTSPFSQLRERKAVRRMNPAGKPGPG